MARDKDDDTRIDYLLSQVGELKGTTAAMAGSLNNLNSDLSRANVDANTRYQEALRVIHDHSKEDIANFGKVNRVIYTAMGGLAAIEFVIRFFLK